MRLSDVAFVFLSATLVLAGCNDDPPGGGTLCSDTCSFAFDGECDDGGEGAITSICDFGSDCGDCGARRGPGGGSDAGPGGFDAGPVGDTDAGPGGCAGGCPTGFSCVLGMCRDNGGGSDNGSEGDTCMCETGTGDPDIYKVCSGTSDGCMGIGLTGDLSCLAGETGAGRCRYRCSRADIGTQGDCPSGFTCGEAAERDITGGTWVICF